MACTSPSCNADALDLLKSKGVVLLDADDVPEDDDTNDLITFLKYEGLLALALLRNNAGPKRVLQEQIKRLVNPMDLAEVSLAEQQRILNGLSVSLQQYKEAIVPVQQKLLNERMTQMTRRTRTNVAKEILTSRAQAEKLERGLFIEKLEFGGRPPQIPAPQAQPVTPSPRAARFNTTSTTSWNQQTITWAQKDTVAMQYLERSQAIYAGKFIDTNLIDTARNIITRDYSLYGNNRDKVAQLIKDGLVSMPDVTDRYWKIVTTNALANARSYANLREMQEQGVHSFVFVAVMDERTTTICRSLNSRVFPVKPALDRMEGAINAQDLESLDKFTPMVRVIKDQGDGLTFSAQGQTFGEDVSDAFLLANGIIIPPLHFLCRSTIKPQY